MNIVKVKIGDIIENNVRSINKAHLTRMIEEWNDNYNRPLLALEFEGKFIIYDGHHRLKAQIAIGRKNIVIQVADDKFISKKEAKSEANLRYAFIQSERTKPQTKDDLGISYILAGNRNPNPVPMLVKKALDWAELFVSNRDKDKQGGYSVGNQKAIKKADDASNWKTNYSRISYIAVEDMIKTYLQATDNEKDAVKVVGTILKHYSEILREQLATKEFKLAILKICLAQWISGNKNLLSYTKAVSIYCDINKCGKSVGKIKWISKQGGAPSETSLLSCFTSSPVSMDRVKKDWHIKQLAS